MRRFPTLSLIITCVIVGAVTRPAAAQNVPRVEVSGGYQFLGLKSPGDQNFTNLKKGWYADVAGNVTNVFAIVGNVAGNSKTITEGTSTFDFSAHQFLVGPRVNARAIPRIVPFGQVLIGETRQKASLSSIHLTANTFTVAAGGGVNLMVLPRAGIRGGVDYVHLSKKSGSQIADQTINGYRISVGVVLAVG